uniref:Uncharacterized protein n=1 Tax=Arundo donax TaxID=35708 RepID=A0A0A9HN20_ARUDO
MRMIVPLLFDLVGRKPVLLGSSGILCFGLGLLGYDLVDPCGCGYLPSSTAGVDAVLWASFLTVGLGCQIGGDY